MIKHSEEFKQEAVRIALTSGLARARVASDLGVGKSTLGKWVSQYRLTDLVSAPQADLARENERLRLENRVLKEERDILKKTVPGWVRLCAVETGYGMAAAGGSRTIAYWWLDTPLKNVAHGHLRT
jgi:transposase